MIVSIQIEIRLENTKENDGFPLHTSRCRQDCHETA